MGGGEGFLYIYAPFIEYVKPVVDEKPTKKDSIHVFWRIHTNNPRIKNLNALLPTPL
jgi:hypothetical protein